MQHRQCVVLTGDMPWCQTQIAAILTNTNAAILQVSDYEDDPLAIPQKRVSNQLGKEFDIVIFDGHQQFDPDSFGIVIGTIKAGGMLIILLPELVPNSLFLQRFYLIMADFARKYASFYIVKQGDNLPKLTPIITHTKSTEYRPTDDQRQAIAAILRVVYGHRRRPLVLSADRGRGKSAALGIAAAQLLIQGKEKIVITAPSLKTADTLFEHAHRRLPDAYVSAGLITFNSGEIKFIAPDSLIQSTQQADIVLIDEAASIPASILTQMLQRYSRIVFATTLHGYEGTGSGFAIRLQPVLDDKTPNWYHLNMTTPIRWQLGDMLEKFSFHALLLDAEPVDQALISDASLDKCVFIKCDRHQLTHDEDRLKTLFGLMRLAHYRTRPSDLKMMLDCQDVAVYALTYRHHIVASAWLVNEGDLDDALSTAIHAGKRRLKGHVLPQSLLAHTGITTAGTMRYQRIIRIAVHPAIRRRKMGSRLLNYLYKQAEKDHDIIGASFSAEKTLLQFWLQSGFSIARLGIHKDTITGDHAIMMLKNTSKQGADMLVQINQRFQEKWSYYMPTYFKYVNPDIIIAISQTLPVQKLTLSLWDKHDIDAFANSLRGFVFSQPALTLLISDMIRQNDFLRLTHRQQHLAVMALLQLCCWQYIKKQLGYSGKKEIITALRDVARFLYNALPTS